MVIPVTKNLNLDNLMDGLFGVNLSEAASSQDSENTIDTKKVVEIALDEIYDKTNHTFQVKRQASDWPDFVASIRLYGVQTPILVRRKPCELGNYECIAGHRRRAGSAAAGLTTIPAIVQDMTDRDADILMIITNKQRNRWTISETAKNWKVLYGQLKNQGQRTDLTSRQIVGKSAEELMEELSGQDIRSVQRTIKLCELIDPLLNLIDTKKLPIGVAYNLSFLSASDQTIIYNLIESYGSLRPEDAQYFRKLSESQNLTPETASIYMDSRIEKTKPFRLTEKETKEWFPAGFTGDKKSLIKKLLDDYFQSSY